MSNIINKDFNKMLNNNKDMPKVQIVTDEVTIKKYGGSKMYLAPPIFYDKVIKQIPKGSLITVSLIRALLAKKNNANFTDPLTAGIFINIVAWASFQRNSDITPYWRVIKSDGSLNEKYPLSLDVQKKILEEEGHTIITRGKKNIKYYVKDYEKSLVKFDIIN